MSEPHALIAGAGIGGLSAALCLARAGWRVSIFEAAAAFEEIGAGLQLSPNASAILRKLNVLDRLKGLALAPEAIRIRRARDGATLSLMPLADAERRWGAPYLLVHRADLQRALLQTVAQDDAIRVHAGAAVAGFAAGADGVVAALRQGLLRLEAAGDCLIGADGARSLVRARLLGGGNSPNVARWTAWRALVEAARAPSGALWPESCLWLGRNAHLVHYPLRGGAVVNVVAVLDANEAAPRAEEDWSSSGDPSLLAARFSSWSLDARALLAAAQEWRKWPLVECDPLPGWATGRVALLGDAAHPMPPFLAQGAAQAIEDAAALGEALQATRDIAPGLAAYAAARRARADKVQLQSRAQGRIYHLSGPAAFARDTAMRALGGERLLARYDWLYRARRA